MSKPVVCVVLAPLAGAGCKDDKKKEDSPPGDSKESTAAKPSEPAKPAAGGCEGQSVKISKIGLTNESPELICDAKGPRAGHTPDEEPPTLVEQPLSQDEWAAAWKAIDATGWQTLADACGDAADLEEVRWAREIEIEIVTPGKTRKFSCYDPQI